MFEHDPDRGRAIIDVLNGNSAWRRPIWLMRQAGRYLPEYRKVREEAGSFLDLCFNPELACEVTLQPLRRFDLDAAILFADILLLPMALGQRLEFRKNEGPVLDSIRDAGDLWKLGNADYLKGLEPVFETVSRVKAELPGHVGLIGFCGAPWTVATYMIEGGTSPDRGFSRIAAHRGEQWFKGLIDRLTECSIEYLCRQIDAGAEIVQVFDTWAGDLPDGLCEEYCFEPIRRICHEVKARYPNVSVIGFARGVGPRQADFANKTEVDAVGLEWSYPVRLASEKLQPNVVVQGNVDPLVLMSSTEAIEQATLNVVTALDRQRHIMNLGHGIKPETPIENVEKMIAVVRGFDGRV